MKQISKYLILLMVFMNTVIFSVVVDTSNIVNAAGGGNQTFTIFEQWESMKATKRNSVLELPEGEEILEERTENTKTFIQNENEVIFISDTPLHYREDTGDSWHDIDLSLKPIDKFLGLINFSDYDQKVEENSIKVYYGKTIKKGLKIQNGDYTLHIKPINSKNSKGKSDNNIKSYFDVWNSVDIEYVVQAGTVKEFIILKDKNAQNTFEFEIHMNESLKPFETPEGLMLKDQTNGKEIFLFEKLFIFDRNSLTPDYDNISWDWEQKSNKIILRVSVSEEWLQSPQRAFPVIIDPTVTANKEEMSASITIREDRDQMIKWTVSMTMPEKYYLHETDGMFYIQNTITKEKLVSKVTNNSAYYGSGEVKILGNTNYLVFVQANEWWAPFSLFYGTTTATITFYQPSTFIPTKPTMSNQSYYNTDTAKGFTWMYQNAPGQNLSQTQVSIEIEKKNDAGTYTLYDSATGIKRTENNITWLSMDDENKKIGTKSFVGGEYRWRIKGYNGKIYSDYSSWAGFKIDDIPPAPNNGLSFVHSLNLYNEDGTLNLSAITNGLKATVYYNNCEDDESGVNYEICKYGEVIINPLEKPFYYVNWEEVENNALIPVDWNKNYMYMVEAVDNVGNVGRYNAGPYSTPAQPSKIINVTFNEDYSQATITYELQGLDASKYKIKWKDVTENNAVEYYSSEISGGSETGIGAYVYTCDDEFVFKGEHEYEFLISTINNFGDMGEYLGKFTVKIPNSPPSIPTMVAPDDNVGFKATDEIILTGETAVDRDNDELVYTFLLNRTYDNQNFTITGLEQNGLVIGNANLEDGHYKWCLAVSDNKSTSTPEESFWRDVYIDKTIPNKPLFSFYKTMVSSSESIIATNNDSIVIRLKDYQNEYDLYPFPDDINRNFDVTEFKIESNYDEEIIVKKEDLISDAFVYDLNPLRGEHIIKVTAFDQAGNVSDISENSIIFDNQSPENIIFDEELYQYFVQADSQITFSWPELIEQPVQSDLGYIIEYSTNGITRNEVLWKNSTQNCDFTVNNLDYNQEVLFRVKGIDRAGNTGEYQQNAICWYTLPEPVSEVTINSITEVGDGTGRKLVSLQIPTVECDYYRVYRKDSEIDLFYSYQSEPIYNVDRDSWTFTQKVNPHHTYLYYIETFNAVDCPSTKTYRQVVNVPNQLPSQPIIMLVGDIVADQYLKSSAIEVRVECTDSDNDTLTYQYFLIGEKDGIYDTIHEESNLNSCSFHNLKEGFLYRVYVTVTENELNLIPTPVTSDTKTILVDTTNPIINTTPPTDDPVISQNITISASDMGSGIKSFKYKWEGITSYKYVLGTGNAWTINIPAIQGINTLVVSVTDKVGLETITTGIYKIDATKPVFDTFSIRSQGYNSNNYITSNEEVYMDFKVVEDVASITSYRYGILEEGQSLSVEDLHEMNVDSVDSYTGVQRIAYDFVDGKTYYPVIVVYNSLGLYEIKNDVMFTVDGTSPKIQEFQLHNLTRSDDQLYLKNLADLEMTLSCDDPETGYGTEYAITTTRHDNNLLWYSSLSELKANALLIDGETYYLVVKAENGVGLSTVEYSEGFIVDREKPEFLRLTAGVDGPNSNEIFTQNFGDSMNISWSVTDHSRITNYSYKVGTVVGSGNISVNFDGADSEGWIPIELIGNTGTQLIQQPNYQFADNIYYITMKAVDEAGNVRIETAPPVKIDSTYLSVPKVTPHKYYISETDKVYFSIELKKPKNEVWGYRYRVVDSELVPKTSWGTIIISKTKFNYAINNLNLTNGKSYFIQIKVVYKDEVGTNGILPEEEEGNIADYGWARFYVDQTFPSDLRINVPKYTTNQHIKINWNVTEEESPINYYVRVGTTPESGDLKDWTLVNTNHYVLSNSSISNGDTIYVSVKAENYAGLSIYGQSDPIIVDNTPPPVPVIIDAGMYTTETDKLDISLKWCIEDPDSTMQSFRIALLNAREITEETNWIEVNLDGVTDYIFDNLSLQHNSFYYIAVEAINGAGLRSIGFSDGILVDTTGPTPPIVNDFVDYTITQDSPISLTAKFESYDPESGIKYYYYSLGTLNNISELVDQRRSDFASVVSDPFNLQVGQIYFFEVVAENGQGVLSIPTRSDGVMPIRDGEPFVNSVQGFINFEAEIPRMHFTWEVNNNATPIKWFEYALITKKDAEIAQSDWRTTNERKVSFIEADGYSFDDGTEYYLAVRVINMLDQRTPLMISEKVVVDTTPPNPPILDVGSYITSPLKLKWTCEDVHSDILEYRYGIGTTYGGTELTDGWKIINIADLQGNENSRKIDRIIPITLESGEEYFITVQAKNGVGLWSNYVKSDGLIADITPPNKPSVIAQKLYTTDKGCINNISISSQDVGIGISAYRYEVVENTNINRNLIGIIHELTSPVNEYQNVDLDITNLNLEENHTYYVAVQMMDSFGQWSEIGYSQGIIVDSTEPALTITGSEVINSSDIVINWSTDTLGCDIFYRLVKINPDDGDNPEYKYIHPTDYSGEFLVTETEYALYQWQVYQEDPYGNKATVSQYVRYNQPPSLTLKVSQENGVIYKGHDISVTAEVSDIDSGSEIIGYIWKINSVEILESENKPILDYVFEETGIYTIEVIVEDVDQGRASASVNIEVMNTLEGALVIDEVWSNDMFSEIRGTIIVPEGITLEIQAGLEIVFPENASLEIMGTLRILGEDANLTTLRGSDWGGIVIYSSAINNQITNTIIRNAKRGVTMINNNNLQIINCIFKENIVGVHLYNSQAKISNSEFIQNQYFGIKEDQSANAFVNNCIFEQNGLSPYYDEELTWMSVDELNQKAGNSGNICK